MDYDYETAAMDAYSTYCQDCYIKGIEPKNFYDWFDEGEYIPFVFPYVKHKEKILYKNRNLCYYICVPEREQPKMKGGFYYDDFFYLLL